MSAKVVARMSGLVTYTDGSKQQLSAHLDERGNISVNDKVESGHAMTAIKAQESTILNQMLATLGGHVTLHITGTTTKTVSDLVMEISGRIARTNNTKDDFIVQYNSQTGVHIPPHFSNSPWAEAVAAAAANLKAMFDAVVNKTNSAVA